MKNGSRTFVRITNQDLFDEIRKLEETIESLKSQLKITAWTASTALTLAILIIGALLKKWI